MSTKEPGVYFLDRAEYERLPRVNWSTLKWLDISPAHYQQALLEPYADSDPKKLGRACHLAVLEPDKFKASCVVWEGGTRRGKDWDAFVGRHPDDEILTPHQHETALAVGRAVRSSAQAIPFISGGQSEVTVLWEHTEPARIDEGFAGFKVPCKSRLDFISEKGALVDLKTVGRIGGAAPRTFGFTAENLKYAAQAAFYRRAYANATGKLLPYFVVAAETMAPYAVQVYQLTPEQIDDGERAFRQLLERYNNCRVRNAWPQYAAEVLPLELPSSWGGDGDDGLASELGLEPAIGFGN